MKSRQTILVLAALALGSAANAQNEPGAPERLSSQVGVIRSTGIIQNLSNNETEELFTPGSFTTDASGALVFEQSLVSNIENFLRNQVEVVNESPLAVPIIIDMSRQETANLRKVAGKLLATYQLRLGEIPFSDQTSISALVSQNGEETLLRGTNLPIQFAFNVDAPAESVVVERAEAEQVAKAEIARRVGKVGRNGVSEESLRTTDMQLEVWVDPEAREAKLAWAVESQLGEGDADTTFKVWVLATSQDDPRVLDSNELSIDESDGQLLGTIWTPTPTHPPEIIGLSSATLHWTSGSAVGTVETEMDGRFRLPVDLADVEVRLRNGYFEVLTAEPPAIAATAEIDASAENTIQAKFDNEFEIAQISAFFWANEARMFVDASLSPYDLRNVIVRVNASPDCNASWNSSNNTITLRRGSRPENGRSCVNRAYLDTIFHEYGHAVDSALGGISRTKDGRSYSEGFGDSLAILRKDASCYGTDTGGVGTCLRDAADVVTYPADPLGTHSRGRIFSGFVWELLNQITAAPGYDRQAARELVAELNLGAAVLNPSGLVDAVELFLLVDDDDLDLSNGTQHGAAIAAAAESRGLPLPAEFVVLGISEN